jgi:hypothetical protein
MATKLTALVAFLTTVLLLWEQSGRKEELTAPVDQFYRHLQSCRIPISSPTLSIDKTLANIRMHKCSTFVQFDKPPPADAGSEGPKINKIDPTTGTPGPPPPESLPKANGSLWDEALLHMYMRAAIIVSLVCLQLQLLYYNIGRERFKKWYSAIRDKMKAARNGLRRMLGMKRKGKTPKLVNPTSRARKAGVVTEQRPPFWNYATPRPRSVTPRYKQIPNNKINLCAQRAPGFRTVTARIHTFRSTRRRIW